MKILAYCVRPDEMESFEKFKVKYNHTVDIMKESFCPANAHLAKGYDAVSILGNCTANREALSILNDVGVHYLATRSAGINNIDFEAAREFDIKVANVPAYSPNSVGEFTVGVTLALARNLRKAFRRVDAQNFGLDGLIGFELRNKTIGFIGTGRIGQCAMKAFSGFGAKMIGYDLYPSEAAKEFIEYRTLEEVFAEADIISFHCPLTKDNYHIIRKENIDKMKDGVILINTSRGALMCAEDVVSALESGKIGGLATDVYEHEVGIFHNNWEHRVIPDATLLALKSFPNVLVTPHYGFYTDEAVANMVEYSLENLYDFETTGNCKNQCK